MIKLSHVRLLLSFALLVALSQSMWAQTPVDARGALAVFPDSQAVLFINARRIVNEMLPRVMTPADYQKMLAETRKGGLDVRTLDYAVVGIRFADPMPANGIPEFIVVVKGGFNADTLLSIGRLALASKNTKTRQESYGSKTIEIVDTTAVEKMAGEGDANKHPPVPYPEIGVTALDSNTLIVGVPAYVKAAIDASGGRGTLKTSTLDLAARDPQLLWSLTADIPPSITDSVHKVGVAPNVELDQMLSWIKQVSLWQGMNAVDYTLNASVLTDAPEHASAFSGLIRMGLLAAQSGLGEEAAKTNSKNAADARKALAVLKTVVNRTEGSTLLVSASVSQATVAEMVREQNAKNASGTKGGTRRRATRRRSARRH